MPGRMKSQNKKDDNTVLMEGVRIIFRNLAGRAGQFNREGERSFAVLLDDDVAEKMASDGWHIKTLKPRADDEEPHAQPYLQVKVNFDGRPPRVVMVASRGRTHLGEDEVEVLDYADIENVDLIIRPYEWTVNDKSGITAYLQSMYATINEDALELKYADLNNLPTRSGRIDDGE